MTKENVKSYYDVLEDLHDLPKENKQRLIIDLQRVWQDASSTDDKSDFLREQGKMRAAFMEEGFRVNELKHIDTSRCYADRENHIALNYDGSLFKCTARDFTTDNREGILLPDGTLAWNEKYSKRMAIKYGNAYCRTCRIFPLCHGGCSQYKLDCENSGSNEDECIRGYDATYMTKIVEDRVSFLLERITPN